MNQHLKITTCGMLRLKKCNCCKKDQNELIKPTEYNSSGYYAYVCADPPCVQCAMEELKCFSERATYFCRLSKKV